MTQKEVNDLIMFVLHCWPTVPWRNDEMVPLILSWHIMLEDVDAGLAMQVVKRYGRQGEAFPPAAGMIAKEALDAADRVAGLAAPDGDQAWAEVQGQIRRRGYAAGPAKWSHDAIDAAVSALGWRDLCLSENPVAMRAHFRQFYDMAAKRMVDQRRDQIVLAPDEKPELPTA